MSTNKDKQVKRALNYWTEDEVAILEEFYPENGYEECVAKGLSKGKREMFMKYEQIQKDKR